MRGLGMHCHHRIYIQLSNGYPTLGQPKKSTLTISPKRYQILSEEAQLDISRCLSELCLRDFDLMNTLLSKEDRINIIIPIIIFLVLFFYRYL